MQKQASNARPAQETLSEMFSFRVATCIIL